MTSELFTTIHRVRRWELVHRFGKPWLEELLKRKVAQFCDTHELRVEDLRVEWHEGGLLLVWGYVERE